MKRFRTISAFICVMLAQGLLADDNKTMQVKNVAAATEVIIYRAQKGRDLRSVYFRIFAGSQQLGKLKAGSYQRVFLSEGRHKIHSNDKARSGIFIDIDENQASPVFIHTQIQKKGSDIKMLFKQVERDEFKRESPPLWAHYAEEQIVLESPINY
ncbi:MAG: hypothetical protein HRU20_08530 [Pseudomonadales bacterium]|nr:hypothetical protein [Pseudomonadales bacterium]